MSQPCRDGCEEVNILHKPVMLFQHLAKKDLQVAVEINESEAQFPWRAFICTKRHLLCVLPSWGRHHFKSSLHLLVIFHAYCVVIHAVYTVPAAM